MVVDGTSNDSSEGDSIGGSGDNKVLAMMAVMVVVMMI